MLGNSDEQTEIAVLSLHRCHGEQTDAEHFIATFRMRFSIASYG